MVHCWCLPLMMKQFASGMCPQAQCCMCCQVLSGHSASVLQASFNADSSRVVSCSWDVTTRIWDVCSGECILILPGYSTWARCVCFSEDGSKVITGSSDGTIKIWDSVSGELLNTVQGHNGPVYSVFYRPRAAGAYI